MRCRYLLNNLVQSTGFYLQWFIQLGNHGDTFVLGPVGAPLTPHR